MSLMRNFDRLLNPIKRRIRNMISRATITGVDASGDVTLLQLKTKGGVVHDSVEYFECYGYGSVPLVGAEALLFCLGGFRVAACALDRRYSVDGRANGDVVIYDYRGQKITLSAAGVAVETTLALTVSAASADFDCNISTTGDISDANGSMQEMRDVFNAHTQAVSGSTAQPPSTPMV